MPAPSAIDRLPLALLLLAACRPAPEAPPSSAPLASSTPLPSAAPSALASAAPPPSASGPLPHRGDGCWGVDLPEIPAQRALALGQRCAPGMTPRFPEPRSVALVHGEASLDLPPLPPGSCLLLAAAHDELLTLSLVDPQSSVLARDTGHRFNLLDAGGPLCVRKGDGLRLLLKGQGVAWIQLWSKAPPSP